VRAALFPGQGVSSSEVLGGLDEAPSDLVMQASEVMDLDLRREVSKRAARPKSPLPTLVSQPAIYVASFASWSRKTASDTEWDAMAGHSLGEFAALTAAGALSFDSALHVVGVRARAMTEAAKRAPGGMAAVLGLEPEQVASIADTAGVEIANDNAPGQLVLSGAEDQLRDAGAEVRSAGGRCVLLGVIGPFHTKAMSPAAPVLRDALDAVHIAQPSVTVVANVTARPYGSPEEIRKLLVEQLTGHVRWRESLEWLWSQGVRDHVDFGPGEVVAGLAERTFAALRKKEGVCV